MIEYQYRIVKEKVPIYVAEECFENKKVVVKGYPERRHINVLFYRDDELLTDISEFNFTDKNLEKFEKLFDYSYGQPITEQYIYELAYKFREFLTLIKDPTIKYITVIGKLSDDGNI